MSSSAKQIVLYHEIMCRSPPLVPVDASWTTGLYAGVLACFASPLACSLHRLYSFRYMRWGNSESLDSQ
jgi:hypothetical protein